MAPRLDETDRLILRGLQLDARRPVGRLAEAVGLSAAACRRRLRGLEDDGVIRRYVAVLDPKAVGLGVHVFVELSLDLQRDRQMEAFEGGVRDRPEVLECYLMTGDADYLLRVVTEAVEGYERFLKTSLTRLDGVTRIRSSFALRPLKYSTALPLGEAPARRRRRSPRGTAARPDHAPPLDVIDLHLLRCLQENARMSNVELAERVGLTPAPCLRRVRALETRGVIRQYAAVIDPEAVGQGVTVFVRITLDQQVKSRLESFEATVRRHPEIMECSLVTGDADYLLRIVVPGVDAYEQFLSGALTRTTGVASIRSSIALRQAKYSTALPLPPPPS